MLKIFLKSALKQGDIGQALRCIIVSIALFLGEKNVPNCYCMVKKGTILHLTQDKAADFTVYTLIWAQNLGKVTINASLMNICFLNFRICTFNILDGLILLIHNNVIRGYLESFVLLE